MDKIEVCRAIANGAILFSPEGVFGGRWLLDYGSPTPVASVDTELVNTLKIEGLIETAPDNCEGYIAEITERGKKLTES